MGFSQARDKKYKYLQEVTQELGLTESGFAVSMSIVRPSLENFLPSFESFPFFDYPLHVREIDSLLLTRAGATERL